MTQIQKLTVRGYKSIRVLEGFEIMPHIQQSYRA